MAPNKLGKAARRPPVFTELTSLTECFKSKKKALQGIKKLLDVPQEVFKPLPCIILAGN